MLHDSSYMRDLKQAPRIRGQIGGCQRLGGERDGELLIEGHKVSILKDG